MALVTVRELKDYYMDIDLESDQIKAAQIIIDGLESELEAYLGRPVERRTFVETYQIGSEEPVWPADTQGLDPRYVSLFTPKHMLYLKQTPIIEVFEVSVTSSSSDAVPQVLTAKQDYFVFSYGIEVQSAAQYDLITVTYEAGLDGTHIPALKTLILRAATREMQNMHDDTVGVKDLTTRDVAPLTTGFTEEELRSIRHWRRTQVA